MHNLFQQAGFFFYDRINNPITCNYCWNEALVLCHVMILGYRGANRIMYRRFNDLGHPNL